jgi:hypothetical protein
MDCGKAKLIGFKDGGTLLFDLILQKEYDKPWDIEYIKPYLRPMSSMTKEEWNDYKSTWKLIEHDLEDTYEPCIESFDWLNANYFDYRGLIDKGLAIEAPEGMYGKEK